MKKAPFMLLFLALSGILEVYTVRAQETQRPVGMASQLSIQQAVALATENNLELRTLRESLGIAQGQLVRAQTFLYNPEVLASYSYVSPLEETGRTSEFSLFVFQQFEIGGQRGHRKDVANSDIGRVEARFEAVQWTVVGAVREAFYQVLLQQRKQGLADQIIALTEDLVSRTEEKFAAGYAPEFDVNFARLEQQKALREKARVINGLKLSKYSLNNLLGRPWETEFTSTGELSYQPLSLNIDSLKAFALNNRRDLEAIQFAQEAAASQARLERSLRIPNLRVSLGYSRSFDNDAFGPIVTLPIKIFNRNKGEIQTALAIQRTAEAEYDFLVASIETEVAQAYSDTRLASTEVQLIGEGMLELVEDNLNLVQQAYLRGEEVEIIQVIAAQRSFVETQTAYLDALYSYDAAVVNLETVLGGQPLTRSSR